MYMLKMWHAHMHWNMKALMTSLILFFIAWMFYWRKNVIFPRLFKNSFVPSAPFRAQFGSIWWKKKSRYLVALCIISELGLFLIHSLACEIYCSSLACNLFWFLAWFMEKTCFNNDKLAQAFQLLWHGWPFVDHNFCILMLC